jgi:hypothetical protein
MTLALNYGDLGKTITEANKLSKGLGQYCDGLSKKVQQKMYSVTDGMSSALHSADYFVNQKISQLRIREGNADELSRRTDTLLETARRVDKDVEQTINANQQAFFKENPHLNPPRRNIASMIFTINWKNIPVLGWLIKGGEAVLKTAWSALVDAVKWAWENRGEIAKWVAIVMLAWAAIGLVVVLCIFAGPAVLGALPTIAKGVGYLLKIYKWTMIAEAALSVSGKVIEDIAAGSFSGVSTYLSEAILGSLGTAGSLFKAFNNFNDFDSPWHQVLIRFFLDLPLINKLKKFEPIKNIVMPIITGLYRRATEQQEQSMTDVRYIAVAIPTAGRIRLPNLNNVIVRYNFSPAV